MLIIFTTFCSADRAAPDGLLWAKDEVLFDKLTKMATSLFAIGSLQNNIMQMIDHFRKNSGTDYRNPILNDAAKQHLSMAAFVEDIKSNLTYRLQKQSEYDISNVNPFNVARPLFNKFSDILHGLKIAINDTAAYKVEVLSYELNAIKSGYKAKMLVTIYDHFGLDKPDLEENLKNLKVFAILDGFRAWFILQHLRGYKPFLTIVENQYEISDNF